MKKKLLLLSCLCMITQLITAQIPAGAVAQYNFSNNYDDEIGNADITTTAAGSYAQDRFTNLLSSLRVEGRKHDGYAFTGNPTNLSIAFWMRIPSGDAGVQRIIQAFDQAGNGLKITFDGTNQIMQVDFAYPGGNHPGSDNVTSLNLKGSWHHIALVINNTGTSYENKFYIDNVLHVPISNAISVSNVNSNFLTSSAVFQISPFNVEDYFGIIDDIVLYERALTASEVSAIYNVPDPNICTVNIPDANFKSILVANTAINTNGNSEIECSEATAYTGAIVANSSSIADATGIEAFENITEVRINNASFSDIDLSSNLLLEEINVAQNQLNSITLPATGTLKYLAVGNNTQLSTLDISQNPNLEELYAANANLSAIDLTASTSLTDVYLNNNNLTALDLSTNTNSITNLNLNQNSISSLDLSNIISLETVYLVDNNISVMDVSASDQLEILQVFGNQLTELNVANGNNAILSTLDANNNPNLTCIQIDSGFTPPSGWSKDVTANYSDNCNATACTVTIPDANFKSILVANTAINTNGNSEIECSEATAYTGAIVANSSSIADATGIEAFENITEIRINNASFSNIDLSSNLLLEEIDVAQNQLNSITLPATGTLRSLAVGNNTQLSTLDISQNPNLEELYAANANFSAIDLTANTSLTDVYLNNNNLTALDLASNINNITILNLNSNSINSLDLSNIISLEEVYLVDNNIPTLDVSASNQLRVLNLFSNQLTELNVANGNNILLSFLDTRSNSNLTCIQIDSGFTPPSSWSKDATASYSDNCSGASDITDPVAVCQDVTLQLDANGVATLDATQVDNGSSDDVGVASLAIDVTSFDCSNVGTTTVTLTVADAAGNTDICTATVTVVDNESPDVVCFQDLLIEVDPGETYTLLDYVATGNITATDNCSFVITQSPAPGTQIGVGDTDISFTATDPSGNAETCTITFTVTDIADTQNPTAVCQDVTIQLDANGVATLDATQVDNGSSDDVGVASLAIDVISFDCSNVGANTVTLTVADAASNTDTCTATITVVDNQAPTITCPADETVSVNQGAQYSLPDYIIGGTVAAQDNCSATITQNPVAGTMLSAGVQTVTFTATDASGLTATCSFDLTVDETLSIDDQSVINVSVYPNPVTDILMIDTATSVEKVEVYALSGQKVLSTISSQVEMGTLSKGIYFVHIKTSQGSSYKRVIKK